MWEYIAIQKSDASSLIVKANELGKQGWEAVSFTTTKQGFGWGNCIMVLKRRVSPSEDAKPTATF